VFSEKPESAKVVTGILEGARRNSSADFAKELVGINFHEDESRTSFYGDEY